MEVSFKVDERVYAAINPQMTLYVDEYNIERYGVPNDTGDGLHNEIWLPVRRKNLSEGRDS